MKRRELIIIEETVKSNWSVRQLIRQTDGRQVFKEKRFKLMEDFCDG